MMPSGLISQQTYEGLSTLHEETDLSAPKNLKDWHAKVRGDDKGTVLAERSINMQAKG